MCAVIRCFLRENVMFTCPGASKLPEWNSPAATVSAAHAADRSWIAATESKHVP